ncbi:DeoR/GlpR family DNA-binding transcription regulator [Atopobacter phocae]|uniref:DeoR/GlpR family DNA-binding transcription regulator n=1 Tax=Atopobacter phocae TaxID=136492 RepID=UPI00046FD289|nr:DeoR/GlpR family DNA-binding transcription regulator [Atopobacter phocae]
MSKKEKRQDDIIHILQNTNGASAKDLAQHLNVSEMTIRRDLKELEQRQVIDNFHGAAVLKMNYSKSNDATLPQEFQYNLSENSKKMTKEKFAIGKTAASMIEPDDIIAIDIGTTTEKMTQQISEDLSFTALVYSANNLLHLLPKSNANMILSGGMFHRTNGMFESAGNLSLIENTRVSKFFLSAAGVHESLGITSAYSYEILVKRTIIKNSLQVILLVDSSKFDVISTSFITELSNIDHIVTDNKISDEWINIIQSMNIALTIVDPDH